MEDLVLASIRSGVPLSAEKRAQLCRDDLFEYAGFFEVSADERALFNGAQLLAYAVIWRMRLSADEQKQLNDRQRVAYAELSERGITVAAPSSTPCRWSFSLRTLFVVMTLAALASGGFVALLWARDMVHIGNRIFFHGESMP